MIWMLVCIESGGIWRDWFIETAWSKQDLSKQLWAALEVTQVYYIESPIGQPHGICCELLRHVGICKYAQQKSQYMWIVLPELSADQIPLKYSMFQRAHHHLLRVWGIQEAPVFGASHGEPWFSVFHLHQSIDAAWYGKNQEKMAALCRNKDLWSLGVIVAWTAWILLKHACLQQVSSMFKERRDIQNVTWCGKRIWRA